MTGPLPLGIRTHPRHRVAEEARVVAMIALNGWAADIRDGREAHALLEAAVALDRWVSLGLGFERDSRGGRRFDIAEVVNFAKGLAPLRGDTTAERFVRQQRALALGHFSAGTLSDPPPSPELLPPAQFEVTLVRELASANASDGGSQFLRLPMPIEGPALRDVLFDLLPPPGVEPDVALNPGHLDIRIRTAAAVDVRCGVRWSFVCDPASATQASHPLDGHERDRWTMPDEGLVKVSDRVRALAVEIAGEEKDAGNLVQRFFDHAIDCLWSGVLHYDEFDVDEPIDRLLDGGWGDSRMGAALVVALCRARGIPARLVAGFALDPACPSERSWLEAWIDGRGWTSWDVLASDLSANGRDTAWRAYCAGRVGYRMKTRILPDGAALMPGVLLPPAWYTMTRASGDGVEIATFDVATGEVLCTDRLVVRRTDPTGAA
jgi:hypothetical protein